MNLITNRKYLERNGKIILKNAKYNQKNNPDNDINYYLNRSFQKFSQDFEDYPGTLEKPNKAVWQSYFKKRF